MSHPNGFSPQGGRGRSLSARRRVQVPDYEMGDFLHFWADLMRRKCGSAAQVAEVFLVTEQTGSNWINGHRCPVGFAVWRAQKWWPEEFAARDAA